MKAGFDRGRRGGSGPRFPLLLALLTALSFPALFAETPAVPFGGAAVSGDWVVYRDRTWPEPTWVGFIQYDGSTWGTFLKTPSSGADVRILFRAEAAEGALVLTGQNNISAIRQSDVEAVNYLMGLLPEMWKWSVEAAVSSNTRTPPGAGSGTVNVDRACAAAGGSARSALLPPAYVEKRDLPDFGGEVSLTWAAEIPVFALAGVTGAGGKPVLSAERTGRALSSADTVFFDFKPLEVSAKPAGEPAKDPAKTAGKAETREIEGLRLTLDGNWTMYADNTYFMGNDAVLIAASVEPRDLGYASGSGLPGLPLALYALFTRSNANAWEVPGNRGMSGTASRFRIDNLFYDNQTGTYNRDIKLCLPVANAKGAVSSVRIVSLSVRDAAYRANPAYFDALLPK